jgi:serine/threonine protein kinase
MSEMRHCPQCGAELPPDAPEGACPKCVLALGFGSSPGGRSESEQIQSLVTLPPSSEQVGEGSEAAPDPGPAGTATYLTPFTAPTPQELAKHFPQLEIIELLGQGGMGAVYKAREPALDRFVAVKILPPEAARDPAFAERFHREARVLAKLNHPNIVAVYGLGQAGGLYYFIMEFVDGVNVRQLMRSGLEPEQALRIVPQICEALQFAHDEGIVHRDIKPENILLDKRGRLKIADFGLARILGHMRTGYTLTGPQQVMGTPNYMAPEQVDDPRKVDHRADIYSLGVVFYEMLTGELPRGRFAPPSKKVQVDVRLDEVVLRALEQQPDRRYQQASEVKTDVETISRAPQPPSPGSPAPQTLPPDVDVDAAREQVRAPALGLLITGIIQCAVTVYLFYIATAAWFTGFNQQQRASDHPAWKVPRGAFVHAPLLGKPLPETEQ